LDISIIAREIWCYDFRLEVTFAKKKFGGLTLDPEVVDLLGFHDVVAEALSLLPPPPTTAVATARSA
jgi:hypothetical protein